MPRSAWRASRSDEGRTSRPSATRVPPPAARMRVANARPTASATSSVSSVACSPRMSYSRKMWGGIVPACFPAMRLPRLRAGLLGLEPGVDERVDVAREHAVHVGDLRLGAVVVRHRVRLQHVRADLAAEVDVLLRPG